MPTFSFLNAYDGVILAIICIGAVYADRVTQSQIRGLIHRTKQGIERTSQLLDRSASGTFEKRFSISSREFEELQALLMLQLLLIWHGDAQTRASARSENKRLSYLVRQYGLLDLARRDEVAAYSYLHNLAPGETVDPLRWNWHSWVEQEKRSRLMYLVFSLDTALTIYFNCEPQFNPSEIKLPLPCDDAAWEAVDPEVCAQALGLQGEEVQRAKNVSGSLRLKQLELHHVLNALHGNSIAIQPRTTNVYSKFILIHAIHIRIWEAQRQRSCEISAQSSGRPPSPHTVAQTQAYFTSISTALARWKQSWDEDMQLQYPPSVANPEFVPRRFGFCRDGVHFYWLARAFIQPDRVHDWQLPADTRFRQAMNGLKQVREWSRSEGARRGEEPGSVADIDYSYGTKALDLDMKMLFRPIGEVYDSQPKDSDGVQTGY